MSEGGVRPTQAPDSRKLNLDPFAVVAGGTGTTDAVQMKASEDQTTTGTSAANSIFADSDSKAEQGGKGGSTSPVVLSIQRTIAGLEKRSAQLDPNSVAWGNLQDRISSLTDKMMQADGQAAKTYIDFKDLTGATITQYVISATKSGRGSAIDPEAAAQFAQGIETIQQASAALQAYKLSGATEEQRSVLREALLAKFGEALKETLAGDDESTDPSAEEPEPEAKDAPAEPESRPSAPPLVVLGSTPKEQYEFARNMAIELMNAGDEAEANRWKFIADDIAAKNPGVLTDGE